MSIEQIQCASKQSRKKSEPPTLRSAQAQTIAIAQDFGLQTKHPAISAKYNAEKYNNVYMKVIYLCLLTAIISLHPFATALGQKQIRVMTYNVENLFDTVDDPEINDEDFLPNSPRRWTQERYERKLRGVARVISSAGEWDVPAIVGLCEVENDSVMHQLLRNTPLSSHPYRYCLSSKSDGRGIRVALLYRHDIFELISQRSISVPVPRNSLPTRNILHVWLRTPGGDTLDIAVCHFPSMSGSGHDRLRTSAAKTLNKLCDSIAHTRAQPHIIVMGDFNAHRGSSEMKQAAGTTLCLLPLANSDYGSYKYRGAWEQIDHILVYCPMQNEQSAISLVRGSVRVYHPSFLLTTRRSARGARPLRTYGGSYYEGGISDHLPVVADFRMRITVQR
jgi:endonuclease/exonuclease/phosphatase family metal-dependent hydrolase